MNKKAAGTAVFAGFMALAFAVISMGAGCTTNPHTPAGHEGYVSERPRVWGKGGFRGVVTGPGNYGLSVWRNEVQNVDLRPRTYTEEFRILASDDLNVSFRVHSVLWIESDSVQQVVEKFGGTEWYGRFVKEPLRTFVRSEVQALKSPELKTKRDDIAEVVRGRMVALFEGTPFRVKSAVVGNIDYPEIVTTAVENKLAAEQKLQEKEIQKAITKKNAEIAIEEARGIAEAQSIINKTLTSAYLQYLAIGAQKEMANSPNHTTVYIPVGNNGIPLVKTTQ